MNIFALSYNPGQAAQALCDKHVPKMVLETAQLLCSPFEPKHKAPYKRTHYNHPCAKWVRQNFYNYKWLCRYGQELAIEYGFRFGRKHKSMDVIWWCTLHAAKLKLEGPAFPELHNATIDWRRHVTPFAQAMPEQYKNPNPVTAYRAYYIGEKARFAKWEKGRKAPRWWPK